MLLFKIDDGISSWAATRAAPTVAQSGHRKSPQEAPYRR